MEKGAHLTSIHSDEEKDFLEPNLEPIDLPYIFIGGRRIINDSFSWADSSNFSYENWMEGEPMGGSWVTNGCIGMNNAPEEDPYNGKWLVVDCDYPTNKYICKKPLKGTFKMFIPKV